MFGKSLVTCLFQHSFGSFTLMLATITIIKLPPKMDKSPQTTAAPRSNDRRTAQLLSHSVVAHCPVHTPSLVLLKLKASPRANQPDFIPQIKSLLSFMAWHSHLLLPNPRTIPFFFFFSSKDRSCTHEVSFVLLLTVWRRHPWSWRMLLRHCNQLTTRDNV